MQIYLPRHLDKLEIISNFRRLLEEYYKEGGENESDSFYDYNNINSLDAIKIFLEYMIPEQTLGEEYRPIIDYYTHKLYVFRGTNKIFEILKEIENIIGVSFGEISYDIDNLIINFELVRTQDITFFLKILTSFLSNLLYFKNLEKNIYSVQIPIVINSRPIFGIKAVYRSKFIVTEEE